MRKWASYLLPQSTHIFLYVHNMKVLPVCAMSFAAPNYLKIKNLNNFTTLPFLISKIRISCDPKLANPKTDEPAIGFEVWAYLKSQNSLWLGLRVT